MQNFSMKLDIFTPDDDGKYVLDDDGFIWTDGERSPRKLFQCGPNEYTTHNLEPIAGNYRRDGVTYHPDTKNGTVTITGKFPFYCTHNAVPVFALPCGNFTAHRYSEPFADLVRLHHGLRSRDGATAKSRKTYQRKLKAEKMRFNCFRCGKPYDAANFMQSYCSNTCVNAGKLDAKRENQNFEDFGVSKIVDRVERSERWREIPYQEQIAASVMAATGMLIRADLFPFHMQKPASILLERYRRSGYLKIIRIDPDTGVKIYTHKLDE